MSLIQGDFIGFSFNGTHTKDLNLLRVSGGNSYSEQLVPAFNDRTATVPGQIGTYYFGTDQTSKTFQVSLATDSVSESQLHDIKLWLKPDAYGELIFDEMPYKVWRAKISGQPSFDFICFDTTSSGTSKIFTTVDLGQPYVSDYTSSGRVYRGTINISFVAYYPYAYSRWSALPSTYMTDYPNYSEWKDLSGLGTSSFIPTMNTSMSLTNKGDTPADFRIYYNTFGLTSLSLDSIGALNLSGLTKIGTDAGFCIDSKEQLIYGVNSSRQPTGTLYNRFISAGDFFKIPVTGTSTVTLTSQGATPTALDYKYWYV